MLAYLAHLLDGLRSRHGIFPEAPDIRALAPDPGFPDVMESSMMYLYGPEYPMEELFGIPAAAFPPLVQLTEDQAAALAQAILDLWNSVNLEADLPPRIPLFLAYPELVRRWEGDPVSIVRDGSIHLEFCSYKPASCPWPGQYCMCKEFA